MSRNADIRAALCLFCALAMFPRFVGAQDHASAEAGSVVTVSSVPADEQKEEPVVRVAFAGHRRWDRVERGTLLEGRLSLPLYADENIVAPANSTVRVTVASAEKVHAKLGFWRKSGRAIVRAFNPLETNHPAEFLVQLSAVDLLLATGEVLPLDVRVLRASSGVLVQSNGSSGHGAGTAFANGASASTLTMALRRDSLPSFPAAQTNATVRVPVEQRTARAYLLTTLRASENHKGDTFRAQLAEPVRVGGRVFPPLSVVEGTVVRCVEPRMLSRAGRLYLYVDRIVPVEGEPLGVGGSLSAAEADAHSRFVLDEEGTLHGRKPGIVNGLADVGYAYFLGKVSDDIAETPIRAIGASMSDAAVASAARYFGLGASVAFLITRHGRDVYLPQYALIEISFGRVNEAAPLARRD